jgi:hypothetical protein
MIANSTSHPLPIVRINVDEMRQRFNDAGYWEKVQKREWTAHPLESRVSTALDTEIVIITSVMYSYHNEKGEEMARVHQYERPDGSIAASGLPDPKRLAQNGTLYRLIKTPKPI